MSELYSWDYKSTLAIDSVRIFANFFEIHIVHL